MPKLCDMKGVREYSEGEIARLPIELWRSDETGRLTVRAYNECGNNYTDVDLWDLLDWLSVLPNQCGRESPMAVRKSFLGPAPEHPELDKLLEATRNIKVTNAQLEEQRISFAYGNAPVDENLITKETVRAASKSIRLKE